MEKKGQELNPDRKLAVSKFGEVEQTLEFAREFAKQILQIATVSEKELKKRQKKDETVKRQNDVSRIREVLIYQHMLNELINYDARQDFLSELNGACKLVRSDLIMLDQL